VTTGVETIRFDIRQSVSITLSLVKTARNGGRGIHMDDEPHSPGTEDDTRRGPAGRARKPRPRWGLVLGIVIAIALIGLIVFLHLTGAIGPGVH
jgi:hypothetical protein